MESGHFHEEVTLCPRENRGVCNLSARFLAGWKSFSGALVPLLRETGSTLRVEISIKEKE